MLTEVRSVPGHTSGPTSAADAIAAFSGAIVTRRLVLRPAILTDAAGLFAHYNDFEVVRWLARPSWPPSLERLHDYILRAMDAQVHGQMIYFTILVDSEPAGAVTWDIADDRSHMGFWLGRRYWGQGYMTEAAGAVSNAVFALSDAKAIFSGAFDGNAASFAVQKKLGFIETGRSVHYCTPRGGDLVHIDTKLTRTARRVFAEKAPT
jgi:RimJ/RimL family protein N-acetyltransferase